MELFDVSANVDADISPLGLQQSQIMKEKLQQQQFLQAEQIQLIVHSPLVRAKQTCQELFGCSSDTTTTTTTTGTSSSSCSSSSCCNSSSSSSITSSTTTHSSSSSSSSSSTNNNSNNNDNDKLLDDNGTETILFDSVETEQNTNDVSSKLNDEKEQHIEIHSSDETNKNNSNKCIVLPEPVQKVINLELLKERTHREWLPGNVQEFENRVTKFQNWLAEQPFSNICIVGHSQFFKQLLGLSFKFANIDVYQVHFDPNNTTDNNNRGESSCILEHDGTADEITLPPQWYDLKLRYSCQHHQQVENNGIHHVMEDHNDDDDI